LKAANFALPLNFFFFGTNGKKNPFQNKENKVEQTKTRSIPHLALPLEGHRKKICPSF